ncbi:unnamed protein product, partial [Ixodes pacificus]
GGAVRLRATIRACGVSPTSYDASMTSPLYFFYFSRQPHRIPARCSAGLLGIPVIFYPTPGRVCGSGCESRTRRSRQGATRAQRFLRFAVPRGGGPPSRSPRASDSFSLSLPGTSLLP